MSPRPLASVPTSVRVSVQRRDVGSASLELVVLAPALLAVLAGLVFTGRYAMAQQAIAAAAADAARAASIARTAGAASADARATAANTLSQQGIQCSTIAVSLDTSGFGAAVGTAATVTATVTCTVNLADLSAPGVPGSKVLRASVSSPLDTYRARA